MKRHSSTICDTKESSAIVRSVVLGGAQLGMRYGGNDFLGARAAFALLSKARYLGFRTWDLAQSYGCAEVRAGLWLRAPNGTKGLGKANAMNFGTKIQMLNNIASVRRRLQRSRRHLGGNASYILLHSVQREKLAAQLRALEDLKKSGEKIGLSLYYPHELEALWREQQRGNCPNPDIIQLPYSIADRRFAPYFGALQQSGVELQLRSLYLQGLLFAPKQAANPFFKPLAPLLNALQEWESSKEGANRADLLLYAALRHTRHFGRKPGFAPNQLRLVVGVANAQELLRLYQSLKRLDAVFEKSGAALRLEEPLPRLESLAAKLNENIVVPALW